MKVNIGPYTHWFGPYQLAEALCWWVKPVPDEYGVPRKPDWVHNFGEWLAYGSVEPEPEVGEVISFDRERSKTLLHRFLLWLDARKKRRIDVHIDRWDTWSADHTLAYVILPVLKQLQHQKHGSPWVDDTDVPEHLRSSAAPALSEEQRSRGDVDDLHEARWQWVLNEMIFAFESKVDDSWQEQFYGGTYSTAMVKLENDMYELVKGNDSTFDKEGYAAYQQRISNGFALFGRYYEALWT